MQTNLSPTDGQQATARYELLRALAIGQPGAAMLRRELTLVLRQGLPAWLAAWRQCPTETAAPVPATATTTAAPTLSLQAELAAVLAAMALAHVPASLA
ncbi:MAG: hypothetical protein KGJ86_12680 [Chloroflexota bacterium]|nr:hypothetical protein [Chloroflexota bacterium]